MTEHAKFVLDAPIAAFAEPDCPPLIRSGAIFRAPGVPELVTFGAKATVPEHVTDTLAGDEMGVLKAPAMVSTAVPLA
jgi:hypothetical protein